LDDRPHKAFDQPTTLFLSIKPNKNGRIGDWFPTVR